jgi:triosephosphate isomerase
MRTPIIAGNWKMHKTIAEAVELTRSVRRGVMDLKDVEVVLCPPFTALAAVREAIGPAKIGLGAQNMYFEECWPNCVNTSSWVTPSDASILVRQTKA